MTASDEISDKASSTLWWLDSCEQPSNPIRLLKVFEKRPLAMRSTIRLCPRRGGQTNVNNLQTHQVRYAYI
ncbi:hypothetical protein L6452_22566 [Arctium lappa]|uniref:Uncharacterized protein n=1 Tax=Arctium lappa TaxID=4217 RepID=A0ACB9B076_ARCLA|nr:hypothetical protein L6452_22566 [Arctium lappa]